MKISILIGTILATTILVMMSFTATVNARSTQPINLIQERISEDSRYEPFAFLQLIKFVCSCFVFIIAWFYIYIWSRLGL